MSFDNFGSPEGPQSWSRKLSDLMDEMLNRDFVQFRRCGTWTPAINLYEEENAFHVCVELAGVDERQIEVQCLNGARLTIRGVRTQPRPKAVDSSLGVFAMEIDEGPFVREIDLPERVDETNIEAAYSRGYLWVRLQRKNVR